MTVNALATLSAISGIALLMTMHSKDASPQTKIGLMAMSNLASIMAMIYAFFVLAGAR